MTFHDIKWEIFVCYIQELSWFYDYYSPFMAAREFIVVILMHTLKMLLVNFVIDIILPIM